VHLMQHSPRDRKSMLEAVIPLSHEGIEHEPNRYPTGHTQAFSIQQPVFPQPLSRDNQRPGATHGDKKHHDTDADPHPTTDGGKLPRGPDSFGGQHKN